MLYLAEIIFRTFEGNSVNKGTVTEQVRYRIIERKSDVFDMMERKSDVPDMTDVLGEMAEMVKKSKQSDGMYHWDKNITANECEIGIYACL